MPAYDNRCLEATLITKQCSQPQASRSGCLLLSLEQDFIAIVLNLFHMKFRVSASYMKYMFVFYSICTNFLYWGFFCLFIWVFLSVFESLKLGLSKGL